MDLRHARYFLAVADERNFTRAAVRLGIAQPPLSQQIKALEEELGAQLFRRLPQGVELTDAGVAFLDEARTLLRQAEHAKSVVAQIAQGYGGRLRLGYTTSAAFHPIVGATVRAFRARFPNVDLAFSEADRAELLRLVAEDGIDAAFVRPGRNERCHVLLDEPTMIVLPESHRCARTRALRLNALTGETLLLFPRRAGPAFYDEVIAACHRAGFEPGRVFDVPQITTMPNFVAAGIGIAIVPASLCAIAVHGVTFVKIRGEAPVAPLALAVSDHVSKTVDNFTALASSFGSMPISI
jgi:DNA-binding transcriptional LysR family regulator